MAAEKDDNKALGEVKTILRSLQRIGDRLRQVDATSKNPGNATIASENLAHEDVSPPPGSSRKRAPSRAGIRSWDAELLADKRPVQGKRLGALALAMLAAGTVIVLAGDLLLKYWPSLPSSRPAAAISTRGTSAVATSESAGAEISIPTLPIEASQAVAQADTVDDRTVSSTAAAVPANPEDIANVHRLMDSGHIAAAREMLLRPDLAASQEGAWLLARSYDPSYLATIQSPDASADQQQAEEWYRRWRDIAARNGMVMDDLRLKRIINSMRSFGAGNNSPPAGLTSPGRDR